MCNVKLPANAISSTQLEPGMKITRAFDATKAIHEVKKVVVTHSRVFVYTAAGSVLEASPAGTFRLAEVPVGYHYHKGHDCTASPKTMEAM